MEHPTKVCASADGRLCGALTSSQMLHVWTWSGELVWSVEVPQASIVALPRDGRSRIAIATTDARIEIRDCAPASLHASIKLDVAVTAMAMGRDDTLVAVDGTGAVLRFRMPTD